MASNMASELAAGGADVRHYPPWREAVRLFLEAGFRRGGVVTHEWLYGAFGIEMPTASMSAGQADQLRLAFLEQFSNFRTAVLVEHRIDLVSKAGVGYRLAEPVEQVELARADAERQLARSFRRATYVDLGGLTAAEIQEIRDNQCRLASAAAMAGLRPRLTAGGGGA